MSDQNMAEFTTVTRPGAAAQSVASRQTLQRARGNPKTETRNSDEVPSIVHEVLRSRGGPLPPRTRELMEAHFGHDFARVRVHTDAQAARSARVVNALAYTVGRDIVFGMGQYQPETDFGRGLLAHELTHAVQQSQGRAGSTIRAVPASDPSEIEATRASESLLAGRGIAPVSVSPTPLQLCAAEDASKRSKLNVRDADMKELESMMLRLMTSLDPQTRETVTRNKTIVIGRVVDQFGDIEFVYTVNDNWTNPKLEKAAAELTLTRSRGGPGDRARGAVGAPNDAEQILIDAADMEAARITAMAVSRPMCSDCAMATRSYNRGGIRVIEVAIPPAAPTAKVDSPAEPVIEEGTSARSQGIVSGGIVILQAFNFASGVVGAKIQEGRVRKALADMQPEILKELHEYPDRGVLIIVHYTQDDAPPDSILQPGPIFSRLEIFRGRTLEEAREEYQSRYVRGASLGSSGVRYTSEEGPWIPPSS